MAGPKPGKWSRGRVRPVMANYKNPSHAPTLIINSGTQNLTLNGRTFLRGGLSHNLAKL